MIILVTYQQKKNGRVETFVSHGVDTDTMENICLPAEPYSNMGYFNAVIGEWVLNE